MWNTQKPQQIAHLSTKTLSCISLSKGFMIVQCATQLHICLLAVSETSNANEMAIFATQLYNSLIAAHKPSLSPDKSTNKKQVTLPQVKESCLEDAGNLPSAAARSWKGRISSRTGHAFLGPLFLRGCFCLTWFLSCTVTRPRSVPHKKCRNTSILLEKALALILCAFHYVWWHS